MADAATKSYFGWQFVGVWIGDRYISLRGPSYPELFSERNRIKCRVVPLAFGWRIVVKGHAGA